MIQAEYIYNGMDTPVSACFYINKSDSCGKLIFRHDFYIYYNYLSKEWSGDELNCNGWVSVESDILAEIIREYHLDSEIGDQSARNVS